MAEKSYYGKFGLKDYASSADIKMAYRKLVIKYHPDKNGGDPKYEKIIKQINFIYETLSNSDLKNIYDRKLKQINELNNLKNYTYNHHQFSSAKFNTTESTFKAYSETKNNKNEDFAIRLKKIISDSILGKVIVLITICIIYVFVQWLFSYTPKNNFQNTGDFKQKDFNEDTGRPSGDIQFGKEKKTKLFVGDSVSHFKKFKQISKNKNLPNYKNQTENNTGNLKF